MTKMNKIFIEYIREIQELESYGNTPETGYYFTLKKFIRDFSKEWLKKDIKIIQQESRPRIKTHPPYCKPDFTVRTIKEVPVGIIECKLPRINLVTEENHRTKGKQIKKYRKNFNNFIFTNFYDFKLYRNNKVELKISLRNKDESIKETAGDDVMELLTKFLSHTNDKSEDFVIQGKGLTEKQIDNLKNNKKVSINRGGLEYTIMETDIEIPKYKNIENKEYIIGGKHLTKKQINSLEYHGFIIINRDNVKYVVQAVPDCYYGQHND